MGDVYFPSAVGYLIAGSVLALVVIAIRYFTRRNWISLIFLSTALLVGVLGMRAAVYFQGQNLLSRYYFPWLILALGATFFIPYFRGSLVSRGQAVVLGILLTLGGSLAWLAIAGRYAVNLGGTFTNFGQEPVWWWGWGPSRLVWFAFAGLATVAWVSLTLTAARSNLEWGEESSTQLPESLDESRRVT